LSSLVTAVITAHTRPQYVYDAFASLCAETYPDIECLVVDDAGTLPDAQTSRRVRVLRSDRGGVACARNVGLAAANGEFIIYLDDDDVALAGRITTLVDLAKRHTADLAFGRTRRVLSGSAVKLPDVPTTAVVPADHIALCDILTCAPHVNSVLVRTAALRDVGGFDVHASHFDDWSAWIRLADAKARICSTRNVVAEWRLHDAGLSAKVLHVRAMKERILALFKHLSTQLTDDGSSAIAAARAVIANANVLTYARLRERDGSRAANIPRRRAVPRPPLAIPHQLQRCELQDRLLTTKHIERRISGLTGSRQHRLQFPERDAAIHAKLERAIRP
jgi:glycosyltransferase involved in cell wall biosynthesis